MNPYIYLSLWVVGWIFLNIFLYVVFKRQNGNYQKEEIYATVFFNILWVAVGAHFTDHAFGFQYWVLVSSLLGLSMGIKGLKEVIELFTGKNIKSNEPTDNK